ncbi:alpha/beta fold hydrolase [Hyalangium versicolor]|uniref:alpha/beta fold hydrolase n=1 Tax=Hyalangium versicolor TaxID=2861190 RepID=UPI001CC98BC8|nr:alpha/beta hydrolase [Hyalangium versicolor]
MSAPEPPLDIRRVSANAISVNVATAGDGPAVLLLHGWPHTWEVWRPVLPALATTHRVIAPDLRGLGASDKPEEGYDLHTLADDVAALLDALGVERAAVVGIDLGAPIAFMTAARHRDRVERLVVMESLIGRLPGAERFLANGPPWWFGFHAVPGLPETVLAGNVGAYIDWFLRAGTYERAGVPKPLRDAFVASYEDPRTLHCGFQHYRAMTANAALVAEAVAQGPLRLPVLALGGNVVGDALYRQLLAVAPNLRGAILERCGHIIPADAPDALLAELRPFLGESPAF